MRGGGGGEVYNYKLSPLHFDPKVDTFSWNLDEEYMTDARSVLFSALQFAVYAGYSNIVLFGVDFSTENYNGPNPNSYNRDVERNLIAFKFELRRHSSNTRLEFGATTNRYLADLFDEIDEGKFDGLCSNDVYVAPPEIREIICRSSGRVAIIWEASEEADGYEVRYRKSSKKNSDWSCMQVPAYATRHQVTDLDFIYAYDFELRAFKDSNSVRVYSKSSSASRIRPIAKIEAIDRATRRKEANDFNSMNAES